LKLFVLLATCIFLFTGCGGPSAGTRGIEPSTQNNPPTIDPYTLNRQEIGKYNVKIEEPVAKLKTINFKGMNINVFVVLNMDPSQSEETEASWNIRKSLNGNCLRIEGLFPHQKGRVFLTGVAVARGFIPGTTTCGEWESVNVNLLARRDFGLLYKNYLRQCESARCVTRLFLSDFTDYYHFIYHGEYEMKFIVRSRRILN